MATDWTTAAWFLPFVLPITIWVAWSDMATMKIPNKAVVALLAVFAAVGLVALPFPEYLWRYAHFGVVLVAGFVMSSLGMMGAGDAKYAAAMAPFVARPDVAIFLFLLGATVIAAMAPFVARPDVAIFLFLLGATVIGAFVLHRSARASGLRQLFPDWESWTRREFPMGFALAPALFFYLLMGLVIG